MCGIPGQLAKDCSRKETAQCSMCGEKGHLSGQPRDREMLMDSGCTEHIVTNTDAFLDFVPILSVVRNPNIEASRVVGTRSVRISIPSNKGEFQCDLNKFCCVSDYSPNRLSV